MIAAGLGSFIGSGASTMGNGASSIVTLGAEPVRAICVFSDDHSSR